MILYNEKQKSFHLCNSHISYIMYIMENGQMGHLYFGKRIHENTDISHLFAHRGCILAPCAFKNNLDFSLELMRQEYPAYGTGDYRDPSYQFAMPDGSRITDFQYKYHEIHAGKKKLQGLPCTFADEQDVTTLEITLEDSLTECQMVLNYHIFEKLPVITRSVRFVNKGALELSLERAMSVSVDFFDSDYEMVQLDGAWSRERHVHAHQLVNGKQNISSSRGASSASHNPFFALKRSNTTETIGEVYGFALIYSSNFLAQAEVDDYGVTRAMLGINPFDFSWKLEPDEQFQTPEAVMVYGDAGLNSMSQVFHRFFRQHLMKSGWSNKSRPILINNWEATYFDFTENRILQIAQKAKNLGIELFVLDDGWFGERNNDSSSLGDWDVNYKKLPNGIEGLAKKINDLDMMFGLWFEPEMVNEESNLYRKHPEWVVRTPERKPSYGRNQFVLDFSNEQVVDFLYNKMEAILRCGRISYVKWDMNRNITEAYSPTLPTDRQKEFYHRYILGVYALYERLTQAFPEVLFESCASGGGRFDAGMLYYAPQAWTSDDTDAVERLHIQYGTSMVYPVVSMGSHVSAVPNHQVARSTSLKMRADTAYFGTFGYELDLTKLSEEDQREVRQQIAFFKEYREVIQLGDFYRLQDNEQGRIAWMSVTADQSNAVVGIYKILAQPNPGLKKIRLAGLLPNAQYYCSQTGQTYWGDELMRFGLLCETEFTGLLQSEQYQGIYHSGTDKGDFTSNIYTLQRIN